jgi:hypothetical protein
MWLESGRVFRTLREVGARVLEDFVDAAYAGGFELRESAEAAAFATNVGGTALRLAESVEDRDVHPRSRITS